MTHVMNMCQRQRGQWSVVLHNKQRWFGGIKAQETLEVEICSWHGAGRSGAADFPSLSRLPQDCD